MTTKSRPGWVSSALILTGALLLLAVGTFLANAWMVSAQELERPYLMTGARLPLPLPTESQSDHAGEMPLPESQGSPVVSLAGDLSPTEASAIPTATFSPSSPSPTVSAILPTAVPAWAQPVGVDLTPEITQIPASAYSQPTPTPVPFIPHVSSPIVRLVIPSINVDRDVITIFPSDGESGDLGWDTDILFADKKRKDLVGQLAISTNPGDGSNIILVGHNFNEGFRLWNGVFNRLLDVEVGDEIMVETEDGEEYQYIVQEVKKLPWKKMSPAELARHQRYLWPTSTEQLTLVTCGGSYIASWSHRIYVVAVPASP